MKLVIGIVICLFSFVSFAKDVIAVKIPKPGKFIVTVSSPSCQHTSFILVPRTDDLFSRVGYYEQEIDTEISRIVPRDDDGEIWTTASSCTDGASNRAVGYFELESKQTTLKIFVNNDYYAKYFEKIVSVKIEEINSTVEIK